MPEIKHQFTGGKMNKDIDERLIPKGEYRDAMNIQVSTSEGPDVGTIQNILGNRKINSCTIPELKEHCVASIADEKNDVGYYLIASSNEFVKWDGVSSIPSPPVQVEIIGTTIFGGHNSSYNARPKIRLMMNSYTNPNPDGYLGPNVTDVPNIGDTVTEASMQPFGIKYLTTVTEITTSASGNNGPDTIDSYIITLDKTPAIDEPWLWTGSNKGYFPTQVSFNPSTSTGQSQITCPDIENGCQLQRDMIVKFDGNSTTPVFVDPYLKTFFAKQTQTVWPVDPLQENQDILIKFEFICKGNLYDVELNDIITTIETSDSQNNSLRFEDLNIRIARLDEPKEGYFHLQLSDIPDNIRPYLTGRPIRFVVGGQNHRVLNFHKDRLITGINIVDNMLFWTDNQTEPKKINIDRSIQGTHSSCLSSTKLIVNSDNAIHFPNTLYGDLLTGEFGDVACKEEHITVIKKSPTSTLWFTTQDITELTSGIVGQWNDDMNLQQYDYFYVAASFASSAVTFDEGDFIDLDIFPTNDRFLTAGDTVVFNSSTAALPSEDDFQLKVLLVQNLGDNKWNVEVLFVEPGFNTEDYYNFTEIFKPEEGDTFKNKFPRFSYRYKYEDGEYSCFAPFTNPVFTPGVFSYEPKKAYNLGMENTIRKITLSGYKNNMPEDVVQVDLLYKESNSPLVYLIDNIKPSLDPANPGAWELISAHNFGTIFGQTRAGFDVSPNIIRATIPSNQLLRPWDNVPRSALAQEVTGNRIVYANYLQNYNINSTPSLKVDLVNGYNYSNLYTLPLSHKNKSLKSMRDYSLGISYLDKFNRQSPVFSSKQSEINIPIARSKNWNRAKVTPLTVAPDWATHCKVFVKDTSNEYYNLAMDRIYDAKDGNVWISFNSSDRNKITDETFLILKKNFEVQGPKGAITEKNRYKILAIENEAPDFIKTRIVLIAESGGAPEDIFTDPSYLPKPQSNRVKIDYSNWNSFETPLSDVTLPLSVTFITREPTGEVTATDHYSVASLGDNAITDPSNPVTATHYDIKLETKIKESWINQSPVLAGASIEEILHPLLGIRIYKNTLENKPEFDGRFFVKIEKDPLLDKNVINQIKSTRSEWVVTASIPFNFMADTGESPQIFGGMLDPSPVLHLTGYQTTNVDCNGSNNYRTKNEWEDELDRLNGKGKSGWFIDAAAWKGEYNHDDLNAVGMLYLDPWTLYHSSTGFTYAHTKGRDSNNQPTYYEDEEYGQWPTRDQYAVALGVDTNGTSSPYLNTRGYNRGIYEETDTNGVTRYYMDLAYSRVGHDLVDYRVYDTTDGGTTRDNPATTQGIHVYADETTWPSLIAFNIHPVKTPAMPDNFPEGLPGVPDDKASWTYQTGIIDASPNNHNGPYEYKWKNGGFDNPNFSHYANDTFSGSSMTDPRYRAIDFMQKLQVVEDSPISGDGLNNWKIGSITTNPGEGADQFEEVNAIKKDAKFKFVHANPDDIVYTILSVEKKYFINHTASWEVQKRWQQAGNAFLGIYVSATAGKYTLPVQNVLPGVTVNDPAGGFVSDLYSFCAKEGETNLHTGEVASGELGRMGLTSNRRTVYKIELDIDPRNPGSQINVDGESVMGAVNPLDAANMDVKGEIRFLEKQVVYNVDAAELSSDSPAIWETEQKSDNDLDIYYEIDDTFPLEINNDTNYDFAPIGTTFTPPAVVASAVKYTILEWNDNRCRLDKPLEPTSHNHAINMLYNPDPYFIDFVRPNGTIVKGRYRGIANPVLSTGTYGSSYWIIIDRDVSQNPITLSWHNCYSFRNGVESDRVRDDFNEIRIDKGARASTTLDEPYKQEHRKTGLIYSGIYNSNSGVNNLNQFIAAEKITKDINPIYGSIQKLHSRDTDLVTLCEDKCLRILSNKDAVFNADGDTNLTATENVLGQTIPFSGEYGISKNPESFASESYRVYFTDKVRGAVMRLSKDGLTPISMYGMQDWFKDNLKLSNRIIGSYDDRKNEYNITLKNNYRDYVNVEIESKMYDENNKSSRSSSSSISGQDSGLTYN